MWWCACMRVCVCDGGDVVCLFFEFYDDLDIFS